MRWKNMYICMRNGMKDGRVTSLNFCYWRSSLRDDLEKKQMKKGGGEEGKGDESFNHKGRGGDDGGLERGKAI
jgi:hypothetical protein